MSNTVALQRLWRYVAQFFVGLFFLASGYLSMVDGLFHGPAATPLRRTLEHWVELGLPFDGYRQFIQLLFPYANALAVIVIFFHIIGGLLLIFNWRPRLGGALLLFVNANILLTTFHSSEFFVIGAIATWLGLYYIVRDQLSSRGWLWLASLLVLILLVRVRQRALVGDVWLHAYDWQRESFMRDGMSITPAVKQWFLTITSYAWMRWVWVASWWAQLGLIVAFFVPLIIPVKPWRLEIASILLVLAIQRSLIWTNVLGAEAVLELVALFVLVTHEYAVRQHMQMSVVRRWLHALAFWR